MLEKLRKELKKLSNKEKAAQLQRYFKTGEGDYGFGDIFLGLTVPQSRELALKHSEMPFEDVQQLIRSEIHEERLIALLILVDNFEKDEMLQRRIYEFYLKHVKYVNNWDLVDLSAPKIVGAYLEDKPKTILYKFASSKNLWEKRIAIISTFHFIKQGDFTDAFGIAEVLVKDTEDLIQKALGWMLREVGNKDIKKETAFLKLHHKEMGRTALRYALEKYPEKERQQFLQGNV